LHILIIESYDSGSHKDFLDGLTAYSRCRFTRLSLPARKWKWRMRGAAIYFARLLSGKMPSDLTYRDIDLIFTSDMTSVADLRALLPEHLCRKPIVCYFHENQLTYPLPDESQRDYQYGFTNITTCLTSDAVWFNSRYHQDTFLAAADNLLRKMPDYVPEDIISDIKQRSSVMPLGLTPDFFQPTPSPQQGPPVILWNHRWEYDKNPDDFFSVLFELDEAGLDFRLLIAGERFRTYPPVFDMAQKKLAHRIDHFGYIQDKNQYLQLLSRANIVISTAIHEYFGLSVRQAVAANCWPLLPDRLSYPELIPEQDHDRHLYSSIEQLKTKLINLIQNGVADLSPELKQKNNALAWPKLAPIYDEAWKNIFRTK